MLRARPDFYLERGSLSLRATEVRQVGLGELLARLEALRTLLAAEGLFAADRKRALPFLPRRIGLITGRASAAERDVVDNTRRRLPGARFRLENVAMQGPSAVNEVVDAVQRLDADPSVDLIVIARGGGSVEDLLPFSNETLVRAVSAAFTPVVSAIGHETDRPLLDLVADLAASTPTDAAKRIVPDLAEELRSIAELRGRLRGSAHARLDRERELMAGLPERLRRTVRARLTAEAQDTGRLRERSRRCLLSGLDAARTDLDHVRARIRSLSPQATLERGYAVVRTADRHASCASRPTRRGRCGCGWPAASSAPWRPSRYGAPRRRPSTRRTAAPRSVPRARRAPRGRRPWPRPSPVARAARSPLPRRPRAGRRRCRARRR